MFRLHRSVPVVMGLALALSLDARAGGQPPPAPVPPPAYYPGYPGGFYPGAVGGAYYGQAALLNASGDLLLQQEQARQQREKWKQEKLVTQKQSFDAMMYEKANTATYTEKVKYDQNLIVQRMMVSPAPAEINDGRTLNAMLPMLKSLGNYGTQGPPVPLDQDQLKHINVTTAKAGGPNLGMLKDGGDSLPWPLCTRGPVQKKVAKEIPTIVEQAKKGDIDPDLYRDILTNLDTIWEETRKKLHKDQIEGSEFIEVKHFIEPLQSAVKALRQPTSKRYLDGTYTAKGDTVPELVNYMTKNGLSFAPCNPGDEAVYLAMHDAFVSYTSAAQAAAGFQVQYAPPRTEPWQVKSTQ